MMVSYMRDNHSSLSDGIQQWTPAGARRFLARALSHRRRGQRGSRPVSRAAIMSHITHLPPALLLDSLIGSSSTEMGYEVKCCIVSTQMNCWFMIVKYESSPTAKNFWYQYVYTFP